MKVVKQEVHGNLVFWVFLFDILKFRNLGPLSFFLVDLARGLLT